MITRITVLARDTPAVADLTRQRDDLAVSVIRLEDENVLLRREVAHLRAAMAPTTRKARAWETALAWLVCRLDAANKTMRSWGL